MSLRSPKVHAYATSAAAWALVALPAVTACSADHGATDDETVRVGRLAVTAASPPDFTPAPGHSFCLLLTVARNSVDGPSKTYALPVNAGGENPFLLDAVPAGNDLVAAGLFDAEPTSTTTCGGSRVFEGKGAVQVPPNGSANMHLKLNPLDGSLSVDLAYESLGDPIPGCATRTPVAAPPAGGAHGLTYDAERRRTLLVQSKDGFSDLFELDATTGAWSHVDVTGPVPTGRTAPGFAYDHATKKTVLFGGNASPTSPRDLWEFDGCAWQNRTPATLPDNWPTFRWAPGMTYDFASKRVIITTGIQNPTFQWETDPADARVYEWVSTEGGFNVRLALGTPPTDRGGAIAVGDRNRGEVYLLTGLQENENPGGGWDTSLYVWNGMTGVWSKRTPSPAPSAREFAAIYHDLEADRIVVVGGVWYGWLWSPELWQYNPDADQFSLVHTGNEYNRFWSPIAYDDHQHVGIQFGGAEADPVYYGNNVVWADGDTRQFSADGSVSLLTAP